MVSTLVCLPFVENAVAAFETTLVTVIGHVMSSFNVMQQRTALSAFTTTDETSRTVPFANCPFLSSRHLRCLLIHSPTEGGRAAREFRAVMP
jgi:hypothetical protein